MALLPMDVFRLDLEGLIAGSSSPTLQQHLRDVVQAAKRRKSRQAVQKLCELDHDGQLGIRHDPPLIWRYAELPAEWGGGLDWLGRFEPMDPRYLESIRPEMQQLLSHFRFSDGALKAVGVGSVGSRCGIAVFVGQHPDDVLALQGKQAEASVLAPYVQATAPEHQGERVVQGQRLLQTSSHAFLGWTLAKAHARSAGWKATQARAGQHLSTHGLTTHDRSGKTKKPPKMGGKRGGNLVPVN